MKARTVAIAALGLVGGIVATPAAQAAVEVTCVGGSRLVDPYLADNVVGAEGWFTCTPQAQHILNVEITNHGAYAYLCDGCSSSLGQPRGNAFQVTQGAEARATAAVADTAAHVPPYIRNIFTPRRFWRVMVTDRVQVNANRRIQTGHPTTCKRDGAKNKAICTHKAFYFSE